MELFLSFYDNEIVSYFFSLSTETAIDIRFEKESLKYPGIIESAKKKVFELVKQKIECTNFWESLNKTILFFDILFFLEKNMVQFSQI